MKKLNELIFRYFADRVPQREVHFPRYEDIQSVVILYESDYLERNTLIKQFSSQLQSEGKIVSTWGYIDKKDISTLILPVGRILGSKDINLFERPKKDIIDDLHKEHWDILIDLTQHDCLPLRYLAMEADVPFKCGMRRSDNTLDFMIDMSPAEDPTELFQQIIHYIKHINQ